MDMSDIERIEREAEERRAKACGVHGVNVTEMDCYLVREERQAVDELLAMVKRKQVDYEQDMKAMWGKYDNALMREVALAIKWDKALAAARALRSELLLHVLHGPCDVLADTAWVEES